MYIITPLKGGLMEQSPKQLTRLKDGFVVFLFFSDNPSQRLLWSMVPQILIVLMKFKITYYILYFTRDSQITTFFVLHIPDFCFFYNKGIKKKKHLKNSTSDYLKGFCFLCVCFLFCFLHQYWSLRSYKSSVVSFRIKQPREFKFL